MVEKLEVTPASAENDNLNSLKNNFQQQNYKKPKTMH